MWISVFKKELEGVEFTTQSGEVVKILFQHNHDSIRGNSPSTKKLRDEVMRDTVKISVTTDKTTKIKRFVHE